MVAPMFTRCPLCGEMHSVPDVRSMDPEEMGCNMSVGRVFDRGLPRAAKTLGRTAERIEDEEWYDATVLGSIYEQQTSNLGRWRHRLAQGYLPGDPREKLTKTNYTGDWTFGPAPDNLSEG